MPYSFTVNDTEITSDLTNDILIPQKVSSESVLTIVYQPQSVFKVNAMTRCSSTLTGHTEAILSVVFSPDGKNVMHCFIHIPKIKALKLLLVLEILL